MKSQQFFAICIIAFACSAISRAQNTTGTRKSYDATTAGRPSAGPLLSGRDLTIEMIKRMMASNKPLTLNSPRLKRMGDQAASDVLTIMAGRGPLNAAEQQRVLEILHMAYERPTAIVNTLLRNPQNTLTLLQRLSESTSDFSLKLRIVDTQEFVIHQVAQVSQ